MEVYEADGGGMFGAIISDMKQMSPILEDLLMKASKFYSALRTSASNADSFLEAFQKLADATTNSKGSTKDLGVSFTKLVMRHKSIENKLKTFLGVFTDSFIWPLQEKLEEYKKATSQLEKDHSKDVKRVKSDTKKAAAEVLKLKKKLSKKGRQEHHDQYSQAVKHADILCSALEDQERHYLRRVMIEERNRTCHMFDCYRPVIEHELSLIGEIENLQSILEETIKQTRNPNQLPSIADDAITHFKTPERAVLPKDWQNASLPNTPSVIRDRANTTTSLSSRASSTQSLSPNHTSYPSGSMTLNRSKTMQSASGYGTLRKSGPPPKPVDLPIPLAMINQPHNATSTCTDPSMMFPTDACPTPPTPPDNIQNHSPLDDELSHAPKGSSINKLARTSWSSNETSDSSGIGSYNSLTASNRNMNGGQNNNNLHNSQQIVKDFLSGNTMEALETHLLGCEDIYSRMTYGQVSSPAVSPRHGGAQDSYDNQFKRNAFKSSSLRGPSSSMINSKAAMLRSNSIQNGDDQNVQLTHEMKLNFQRGKHNTVAGRPCNGGRASVFQVFNESKGGPNQHPRSPTNGGSPTKWAKPPPPVRSVSYHGHKHDQSIDKQERKISEPLGQIMRDFDEAIETDYEADSNPNSFLAQIQAKRRTIRRQSVTTESSIEEGTML